MRALLCIGVAAIAWQAPTRPVVAVQAITPAAAEKECGDFLARMGKKPPRLAYAGCTFQADRQGKPLRALYRVSGRNAAAVEVYLIKAVRLNKLRRSCCQWDSPPSQFRDARGREYSVTMTSDETPIASRKAWPRIARFEVVVEKLTEDI